MTVKIAIQLIEQHNEIHSKKERFAVYLTEALKMAVNALEKQIPKKPINKTKCDNTTAKLFENCNIVVCPLCNGRLKLKSKGKHCDKCGQVLDWGE